MSKKKFENLTRPEQRVAIFKDLLARIHSRQIKAQPGLYLWNLRGDDRPKIGQKCKACELGGLLFSLCGLDGGSADRNIFDTLGEYFPESQMDKMERAFEGGWNSNFPNAEDRMIAITQNAIDHNGTFKPNVMYEMV